MVRQTRSMRRGDRISEGSENNQRREESAENVSGNAAGNGAGNRRENFAAAIQDAMAPVLATMAQLLARIPVAGPPPAAPQVGNVGAAEFVAPGRMDREEVRREAPARNAGEEAREERVPSYLKVLDYMQRWGTDRFAGSTRPEEADKWRAHVERNFEALRCPDQYKTDIGVHFLEGDAHMWWKSVLLRRGRVDSWRVFREEFNAKYFPKEAVDRLESQFLDLRQGARTVHEYEAEFTNLKRFGGRDLEDETVQIRRFLRGMRLELRNRCLLRDYVSMADLVEKAAVIESGMVAEESKRQSQVGGNRKFQAGSAGNKSGNSFAGQKRKWEGASSGKPQLESGSGFQGGGCFRCGSKDHRIANCPKPDLGKSCNYCKEPGHFKDKCPKLAQKPAQRGGTMALPPPPPKRPESMPQVYTMAGDGSGPSTSRPITA